MTVDDASTYFGSDAALTRELGLRSQSTLGNWRRRKQHRGMIPELYARRLKDKYDGTERNGVVLKFDESAYQ